MPSLNSEFSPNTDHVGQQFKDMDDAIIFLRGNLEAIAKGTVLPIRAKRYAGEALKGLQEILLPR